MYYYQWTPREIKKMSEKELCEAWQNLLWVRSEEARLQKKRH